MTNVSDFWTIPLLWMRGGTINSKIKRTASRPPIPLHCERNYPSKVIRYIQHGTVVYQYVCSRRAPIKLTILKFPKPGNVGLITRNTSLRRVHLLHRKYVQRWMWLFISERNLKIFIFCDEGCNRCDWFADTDFSSSTWWTTWESMSSLTWLRFC